MAKKKIHPGYKTITEIILPKLKGFQTDVTKHDKAMLTGYEGDFIIAYRDNGTNLYRLDDMSDACNWEKQDHRNSIKVTTECCVSFLSVNQHFMLVDKDGKATKITKYDATDYILQREMEALEVVKFFEQINLKQIAFELMTFIKYNGRVWKSRLRSEWDSSTCAPAIRRLRNHFNHTKLFKQKSILAFDTEEQIFSKLAMFYIEDK